METAVPTTFTCACCGREITGIPDLGYDSPAYYTSIPEDERERRARLDSDLCVLDDEHFFIRAVCPIPIVESGEHFSWGIWVSLSEPNFKRYAETFDDDDQSTLGEMFGWFSNAIPFYPDTLTLQTTVEPLGGNDRPLVWINSAHADHPLYIEQREGITLTRLGEIYAETMCTSSQA